MKIDGACADMESLVGAGSAQRLLALGTAVLQPQHAHVLSESALSATSVLWPLSFRVVLPMQRVILSALSAVEAICPHAEE